MERHTWPQHGHGRPARKGAGWGQLHFSAFAPCHGFRNLSVRRGRLLLPEHSGLLQHQEEEQDSGTFASCSEFLIEKQTKNQGKHNKTMSVPAGSALPVFLGGICRVWSGSPSTRPRVPLNICPSVGLLLKPCCSHHNGFSMGILGHMTLDVHVPLWSPGHGLSLAQVSCCQFRGGGALARAQVQERPGRGALVL